jgi:tetratricopeptide (TPR) repeat protein
MDGNLPQPQLSPRDVARWQKVQGQLLGRRFEAALPACRTLARRFPFVPELLSEPGNAASGDPDFAVTNQAYRRALYLAPGNSSLLSMIGEQYQGLRQLDDARNCFERAVAAIPDSVDARIRLAMWFEKERRQDEAWDQVEACLAGHPRHVIISCFFLNVMLNATNVNFLSLERIVKYYTDLMNAWLRMRDLGALTGWKRAMKTWCRTWRGRDERPRNSSAWRGILIRPGITKRHAGRFFMRRLTTT